MAQQVSVHTHPDSSSRDHARARVSPRRRVFSPLLDSRFSNVDGLLNEGMGEINLKSCIAAALICAELNNDTEKMQQVENFVDKR